MKIGFVVRILLRLASVFLLFAGLDTATTIARADKPVDVAEVVCSVGPMAINKEEVVGLSIGVAQGDAILCTKGFGLADAELDVPVGNDTVFRIGSITKQFTAVAILLLVEDGKVRLDDPLSTFLPDYPTHARKVTVKHLLQHTSGIKDFTRLPAYRKELPAVASREDIIGRFKNLPLNFEPGEQHRYCNSGYFLLAAVVEKASGESFQRFVEDRLFRASKLTRTCCDSHVRIIPGRASGYTRWNDVLKNARHINLQQTVGAGNIASTVGDLLVWQQALISNRLLKPQSLQMMMTKGELNNGKTFNYGYGLLIQKLGDHEVIRHGGGISGFRADLAYYPESGYTIAVLANSENADARRISDRIAKRILDRGKNRRRTVE